MSPSFRPRGDDEPALLSPELRQIVGAIRAAPPPVLKVTAESIAAAAAERRAGQRRLVFVGLAAAAAALLLVLGPWHMTKRATPGAAPSTPLAAADVAPAPRLAPAIRVDAAEGTPEVRGPWALSLPPGRYTLEVDPHAGDEVLRADTPHGALELRHGRVEVVVAAASTQATLSTGVARWVAPEVDPVAIPIGRALVFDDASSLARRADKRLELGDRAGAIALLERLVREHPGSPVARTGLIDLARLLRADGRPDAARCAYKHYLARYPEREQLADEVERALRNLGEGPPCDDLQPK